MISKIFPSLPSYGCRPLLCHTSKFIEMGGRAHFFLSLVGRSSISALICDSFMPAMRLILGTQEQWAADAPGSLEEFQGGGEREPRSLWEVLGQGNMVKTLITTCYETLDLLF